MKERSASPALFRELRTSGGSHVSADSNLSQRISRSIELPPPELSETGSAAKTYADHLDNDSDNEAELGTELSAGADDVLRQL